MGVSVLCATLLAVLYSNIRARPSPAISVVFKGMGRGGLHLNPYGEFTITNHTDRKITFLAGSVEAPMDPTFESSQMLVSTFPFGELRPHATADFHCLVAAVKGVPFRISLSYPEPCRPLAWVWIALESTVPLLRTLWNPPVTTYRLVYSPWYITPSDYHRSVPSIPDTNVSTLWPRNR